jgi:hypothetical protein
MLESLGSLPPCVFPESVPQRRPPKTPGATHGFLKIKIAKVRTIREAFIFEKAGVRLILAFEDGTVQRFSVKIERREVESVYLAPLRLRMSYDARCVLDMRTVFALDWKMDKIHCIGFEQIKSYLVETTSVGFVIPGLSHGQLLIGTDTGQICGWAQPGSCLEQLFSVNAERIHAADFDRHYGIFVCTTADRFLRFINRDRWRQVRCCDLGCIGQKLLVTDGWCFVVVWSRGRIWVFTLNGFLVKTVAVDFDVHVWSHWTDTSGFDFVCLTDPIGNLFVFEAFYPEHARQIASLNATILRVEYSHSHGSIVAVGCLPIVYIIPLR